MNYKNKIKTIRSELDRYLKENSINALIIGISGGIDSTLCAALAAPVCKENNIPLIGRSIPITTNTSAEIKRAQEVGKYFCDDFEEVRFDSTYYSIVGHCCGDDLTSDAKKLAVRLGNMKARLRMIYLYDLAQKHRGMVLSTDNYTEYNLGFWTLHGDVGDFGMIQNLWKTQVYEMTEYLLGEENNESAQKCLKDALEAVATDGLGITNSDLDQLLPEFKGTSREGYKIIDKELIGFFKGEIPVDGRSVVIRRHLLTKFKRNNPYNISLEDIEFGSH